MVFSDKLINAAVCPHKMTSTAGRHYKKTKTTSSDISPTGFLDDIMTQALMEDKVNFVRLLLQNSVVMHEYLTVPMLRKLYNSAPKMSHLRDQLTRYAHYNPHCTVFLLQDVNRLLRKLLGKHTDEQYRTDNNVAEVMKNEDAYTGEEGKLYFQYPFRELFLWAVLMNR